MEAIISKRWSLKLMDFIKGLKMAVGVPCLVVIQQSIDKGEFNINWKLIGMTAVGSFVVYLIKNFTDKTKVIIPVQSNEQAKEIKENIQ